MRKHKKPTKSQRDQQDAWDKLRRKWASPPKYARELHATEDTFVYTLEVPRRANVRSLSTPGGETPARSSPVYTGESMLGIAQMSKSNAVPVFSKEDAVSIARMRRG